MTLTLLPAPSPSLCPVPHDPADAPVWIEFRLPASPRTWYRLGQPVLRSEVTAWMSPSWTAMRLQEVAL